MRVLLVRPTASGGLAAHVDQELALLESAGRRVAEAPVRIRERPSPRHDAATVTALRRIVRGAGEPVAVHAHG
ncbi:glycosyl transferase, partial [Brachybacterium conglomeratum]